jgi:hypothetical protein
LSYVIWGYAEELAKEFNEVYSKKRMLSDEVCYDYDSGNKVSQHVNIMLSVVLQKMIDKTEAIFLLNTDKSINIANDSNIDLTYSPWIYSEIICTHIVRKKPLIVYRNYEGLYKPVYESVIEYTMVLMSSLTVSYNVALKHLKSIVAKDVFEWRDRYSVTTSKKYPLDRLYEELEKAKSTFIRVKSSDIESIKNICSGNFQDAEMLLDEKLDFLLESSNEQRNFCSDCYCERRGYCCCYNLT